MSDLCDNFEKDDEPQRFDIGPQLEESDSDSYEEEKKEQPLTVGDAEELVDKELIELLREIVAF